MKNKLMIWVAVVTLLAILLPGCTVTGSVQPSASPKTGTSPGATTSPGTGGMENDDGIVDDDDGIIDGDDDAGAGGGNVTVSPEASPRNSPITSPMTSPSPSPKS